MTRQYFATTAGLLLAAAAGLTAQTGGRFGGAISGTRGGAGSNLPMEFQQAGR